MSKNSLYTEENIRSLDWKEHIRMRPGMYIGKLGDGSSPDDGIYILLKEILDNCIDEFVMGAGKTIDINIQDKETYLNYEKGFFPILKKYGGEFITFDDKIEHLEGEKPIEGRTILWTFPSEEDAKAWYNDPEYQELAKIRRSSAILNNLSIIKSLPKRS